MKILFIIPGLAIGGQEKITMMLTNELMKYHEVVIVCFEEKNPLQYNFLSPIIRIENEIRNAKIYKIINVVKRVIALRKIKKNLKPDVSVSVGETAIVANAFTFTSEFKIASIHQSIKLLKGSIYKFCYQKHDKIIPVSNGINYQLKEVYGIENNLYIHNGYDIDEIISSSQKNSDGKLLTFFNGKVIAHLGRFDLPKGHWHLIVLFVLIKKLIPESKLLLIGDYDKENDIFQFCIEYLKTNGVKYAFESDNNEDLKDVEVLFTGHQSNPFSLLKQANVFVFPSLWEGFGNALVEAMACGLPIVAADCPTGPKEILIDEKGNNYGILLPSFELNFQGKKNYQTALHKLWADEIVNLLKNNERTEFYKHKSLERCKEFSLQKSVTSWLEVIEKKNIED